MYYRSVNYRFLASFALGCLLAVPTSSAQDPAAAELARMVDSQTVVVARVDLGHFDTDLITSKIATFLGEQPGEAPWARKVAHVGEIVNRLKKAGVSSVFFVGDAQNLMNGPALVVPRATRELEN